MALAKHEKTHLLSFYHTHTGERMEVEYHPRSCSPELLSQINYFLRDFRTGEVHPIDQRLLAILCMLQDSTQTSGAYEIISGYRSPSTNSKLRKTSSGVAKKSLHMKGQALDIRITDFNTAKLRDLAIALRRGGVGYYAKSDFVHLDTGRVRFW
jgi:uncharacterized protein YcbK (DUF882 family)